MAVSFGFSQLSLCPRGVPTPVYHLLRGTGWNKLRMLVLHVPHSPLPHPTRPPPPPGLQHMLLPHPKPSLLPPWGRPGATIWEAVVQQSGFLAQPHNQALISPAVEQGAAGQQWGRQQPCALHPSLDCPSVLEGSP